MSRPQWRVLDGPPADWETLVAEDPGATPAHRGALWAALAATLPGFSRAFVAVEREGALLGGVGVMVERRGGLHWIHLMPYSLPGAPLARTGAHEEVDAAVAEALDAQAAALGAVGGAWIGYRPLGPDVAPALERLGGETRWLETSWIDLSRGATVAFQAAEGDLRQQVRRARRLGLRFAEEPGALEEAYVQHAAQSRSWSGHRPLPLALCRRLLTRVDQDPAARLFTVRDDRGLLAAVLALVHAREVLAWWSGTHPEGRHRHAFPLLLWSLAEWCAERGVERLNLGASGGFDSLIAFKRSFGARSLRYPVRWLDACHAGPLGRAVARAQSWWRRDRARGESA